MAFLLASIAEFAVMCCGLAAALILRPRLGLWLCLAGALTGVAADFAHHALPLLAMNSAVAGAASYLLWHFRRRRKRAPRAYGAKSRARVAALVRKARESARPRPGRRPAPQGSG